ncbi:MAG: tRNA pseudouridine(38-40) synthase TruA [Oscillospiraceae bacterium]|nr:tRNA pseudouridine(38-40) synthase TruA [Oscillospiraceae bacterium]
MRNLRLNICYEGTRYRGWQRLTGTDNTIQAKIETALSRILGETIEISASGRTDAGTHAIGQVANFHCVSDMPCEEILSQLRCYLPEDIGVYSCKNVSPRFHARLNAKTKTYHYRVWNSNQPCVFQRKFVYKDPRTLDLERMQQAAKLFEGQHDFSAFCANKNMKKSTQRYIQRFDVYRDGEEVIFSVTGNGFLHHMVRIMVGTLLEIGRGERQPETIDLLFGAKRADAGELIPACGLCLMEVTY